MSERSIPLEFSKNKKYNRESKDARHPSLSAICIDLIGIRNSRSVYLLWTDLSLRIFSANLESSPLSESMRTQIMVQTVDSDRTDKFPIRTVCEVKSAAAATTRFLLSIKSRFSVPFPSHDDVL